MQSRNPTTAAGVETVTHHFDSQQIPYELIEHAETFSAVGEAVAAHVEPSAAGKTLLLRDHDDYRLVLLPADRHLDLRRVRELMGASRHLRLATEVEMARDFPVYEVGALPPIGPTLPPVEIVDVRLLDAGRVLFAAGDHRHSIVIPTREPLQVTEPRVADVCEVRDDIEDW
jgi:Ala-tRNA(Pro) deacylase